MTSQALLQLLPSWRAISDGDRPSESPCSTWTGTVKLLRASTFVQVGGRRRVTGSGTPRLAAALRREVNPAQIISFAGLSSGATAVAIPVPNETPRMESEAAGTSWLRAWKATRGSASHCCGVIHPVLLPYPE